MKKNNKVCYETLPKREQIISFVYEVRNYLFPGYFEKTLLNDECYRNQKLKKIKKLYRNYICYQTVNDFVKMLPKIQDDLSKDLDFFMASDPAIDCREEVVIAYPGFLAIMFYRIAHVLADFNISFVPRIITEVAHSKTGIDIHPRAVIGVPFFIDHGTGIVIGETSEVGNYVKMYHGVTLGALSLKGGSDLKGKKRHPTIKNNVTIYAGASILGGETIIEDNVTIGSNVFIVNSVLKDTTVIYSDKKQ